MTEDLVRAVGPAFARYLSGFERHFDSRSIAHLRNYTRGLLTDFGELLLTSVSVR